MTIDRVYAVLCVADIESALPWYERAFGRPADNRPMQSLGEWHVAESGGLQVFEDASHAGQGFVTMNVPDLDALMTDLESRGVAIDKSGVDFDPFRLAAITDPDGNRITFAQNTRR